MWKVDPEHNEHDYKEYVLEQLLFISKNPPYITSAKKTMAHWGAVLLHKPFYGFTDHYSCVFPKYVFSQHLNVLFILQFHLCSLFNFMNAIVF